MTTRSFRFQSDIDADGVFRSGQLFDQVTFIDPITDVVTGGALMAPVTLTDQTHPAVFAALNAEGGKVDDRIAAARAKIVAAEAAKVEAAKTK